MVAALSAIRLVFGWARLYAIPIALVTLPLAIATIAIELDGGYFQLLSMLGRDTTYSGRIPLWSTIWPFAMKRFWLGYGYEAFFVQKQEAMKIVEEQIHYRPFYAHNGLLQLQLSLGVIGMTIFCILCIDFLWRLFRYMARQSLNTFGFLSIIFITAFILRNFFEVAILTRNDAYWCVFLALYLQLAKYQHSTERG
jgi:O-antigen ligase